MGSLYKNDINKYKNYFKESAKKLGLDVEYSYIIKRNTENQSGESTYSELSKPIIISVIVEQGNPKIDSLKQLGWFTDTDMNQLLVDFSVDTPNLQEGCRIKIKSNENSEQTREYDVIKLSTEVLYPSCIKCLCQPILENESNYNNVNGDITYGQQDIISDDENYSFINSPAEYTIF